MSEKKNQPIPRDPKQPHPKPYSDKGLPPVQQTPNMPPVKPPKK